MIKNYLSFYFVLISALVISLSSIAQSPSESSKYRSINELKSAAKDQSKLIMVQFYIEKTIDDLKKIYDLIDSLNLNDYLDNKFIRLKVDVSKDHEMRSRLFDQIRKNEYYDNANFLVGSCYIFNDELKFLDFYALRQKRENLVVFLDSSLLVENQVFTQLSRYKDNKSDPNFLRNLYGLVSKTVNIKDKSQLLLDISDGIAKYSRSEDFFTPKNSLLVKTHIAENNSEVFKVVLRNMEKYKLIDSINDVHDVLAEIIIDDFLIKSNLKNIPLTNVDNSNNFNKTNSNIGNKKLTSQSVDKLFKGKYATINYHKMKWTKIINQTFYTDNANAIAFIDSILAHNVSYRPRDLNSWIYKLFSGKQEVFYFQKAYQWAAILTKTYPQNYHYLETKAIALYNINRTEEAISVVKNILKMPLEEKDVVYYTNLLNRMKSEE